MNGHNGDDGDPIYIDDECEKRWKQKRAFIREEEEHSLNKRCKNCKFILCVVVAAAVVASIFLIIATGLLALPPLEIEQTNKVTPPIVIPVPQAPTNSGDSGEPNSVVINLEKLIIKGDQHDKKKHRD